MAEEGREEEGGDEKEGDVITIGFETSPRMCVGENLVGTRTKAVALETNISISKRIETIILQIVWVRKLAILFLQSENRNTRVD